MDSKTKTVLDWLSRLDPRVNSRSMGRRLITQEAVRINGEIVEDIFAEITLYPGDLVEIGRSFSKVLTDDDLGVE